MSWPLMHCTQPHLANLRPVTQHLLQKLGFCLVPLPGHEFRFVDVEIAHARPDDPRVEFLVFLMEDRTATEVLRALPRAVSAANLEPLLAYELEQFFTCLARVMKYNASAFVIEPPERADIRASLPGVLPRTPAEQAEIDGLPLLPAGTIAPGGELRLPNKPDWVA